MKPPLYQVLVPLAFVALGLALMLWVSTWPKAYYSSYCWPSC